MADAVRSFARAGLWAATLSMVFGCERSEAAPDPVALWDRVESAPDLEHGRRIWKANCKRCHAYGIEGAPRLGDAPAWAARAKKGVPALIRSVIEGVQGKAGGEMPPRAGNPQLSDAEIQAAVAYVLAASR
jgi:cytochrome c5